MLSAVNGTQDYQKLLEIVRNHPYIDNDTTAQLFIILGLQEVYADETFKKDKVLSMLNTVKLEAVNRENKRIAENVMYELTFLKKGKEAPEFSLQDRLGNVHHLEELKGKPVLLFFWSAGLNVCLRDISLVNEFYQKYGSEMAFVAINMDDKTNKALKFSEDNQLEFLLLYKDHQYDVIDKYRVYGLPMYVLIDADGNIVQCPAKRPEANLENDLFKLISENGKK